MPCCEWSPTKPWATIASNISRPDLDHHDTYISHAGSFAMAATPELAIAKAALSASLFRADPVSQTRPSVESFFALINQTIGQCSRPNIQVCSRAPIPTTS